MIEGVTISQVATVEQAREVRRLFLEVYGEEYPVRLYYEPELLLEANHTGTLLSMIASDQAGKVLGHCALYSSAPNPRLKEVGAALVHPSTRGQGVAVALGLGLMKLIRLENLADWLFTEAVCNHPATQIASAKQGFVETALELSLMPASAYRKEESAQGRVSTMLSFFPLHDSGSSLNVPPLYQKMIASSIAALDIEREISKDKRDSFETGKSVLERWNNEAAGVTRWRVDTVGRDLRDYLDSPAEVSQVYFRLSSPNISWAVEEARAGGYFYSGYLPCWFGGDDGLLMQRLTEEPVWDELVLASGRARSFGEVLRSDRQTVVSAVARSRKGTREGA